MKKVNIPVGRSDFEYIRKNDYYYIDKTGLIEELLKTDATQVTLITRPRRFGKTLGMSMMAEFFDIRKDSHALFEGLSISENKELCKSWMNQYPTVFVSFRNVDGLNFKQAYEKLSTTIADLYNQHYYLLTNNAFNTHERNAFNKIAGKTADNAEVENSLLRLTKMLSAHYGKPTILLIDEYDVP
ncbi:MAG: AAA family ATPase, partial [Elusimicrobiales bacterium]|nr:AAA family ATPase [Elusimicrobiales bacterium]